MAELIRKEGKEEMYTIYGIIDKERMVYIGCTDEDISNKNYYYKVYNTMNKEDIYSIKEYNYKNCVILKDNIKDWVDAIRMKEMLVDRLNPIYNKINDNGRSNYIVLPLIKRDAALNKEYEHLMLLLF